MYRGGDLLELLHGSMPDWLLLVAALVTRLGDVWVVISITVTASWLLTWRRSTSGSNTPQQEETDPLEATPAIWMVGVVVGGLAAMTALKYVFVLPRPSLVAATPAVLPPALESIYVSTVTIGGYGFPSGHALGATVAYGLLALTLRTGSLRVRLAVTGVLVLAVSCSRVVLAVHYPGDIVAGIAVGTAYLVAVLWLLERSPFDRTTSAFALALGLALVALVVSDVAGRSVTYIALAAGGLTAWSIGRPRSRPRTTPHAVIATLALGALAGDRCPGWQSGDGRCGRCNRCDRSRAGYCDSAVDDRRAIPVYQRRVPLCATDGERRANRFPTPRPSLEYVRQQSRTRRRTG